MVRLQLGRLLLLALYKLAPRRIYEKTAGAIAPGRVLLDVGGARGRLAESVGNRYELSLVLDVDAAHFPRHRQAGVEFICASACYLPLRRESVDSAVFHDSLHHMDDPEKAVQEAAEALRVNGKLYVFDFDRSGLAGRALLILERALGFPARLMTAEELERLMSGLRVLSVRRGALSTVTAVAVKPSRGTP